MNVIYKAFGSFFAKYTRDFLLSYEFVCLAMYNNSKIFFYGVFIRTDFALGFAPHVQADRAYFDEHVFNVG